VVGIRRDQYHVRRQDDQTFVTTESDHGGTGWHVGTVFAASYVSKPGHRG